MNKTELQQKIVDIEKQLAELKKELERKDKGIWKPEKDEEYYYLRPYGVVIKEMNTTDTDYANIEFGNYFKTKEEAEKMANYLKYTNLLRKYVEEHSEPIDWENTDIVKYNLEYDCEANRISTGTRTFLKTQGTIYASSEEVLKEAISFVGEENIKRYIFGVEE